MRKAHARAQIAATVGALLLLYGLASAQIMIDPTRPPRGVLAAESGSGNARAPVLQSVIITPKRRSAIIDGERVELGGKYGDAEVVSITESEVVLRSTARTETLKMYPDVDKAVRRPGAALPKVARDRTTGR